MKNEEFEKYVSEFDMNNSKILLKYKHTYRVVGYCTKLAEMLNLNEHDKHIAELTGLLHDIARFPQARDYDTFKDAISFDHGDKGYEILKENDYISKYIDNEEDKNLILKAVKYHNKKYLEGEFTDRERLFCELIRDADKLDIMDFIGLEVKDNSCHVNKEAFEEVKNRQLVTYTLVENDCTNILKTIAYIFDFNFKESFIIMNDNNIIERKFNALKNHLVEEELQVIENTIKEYINERLNNDK